ncbi:MAG: family 43 glycosylhydrolase [Bacteriovoracia bacterium]
MRYGSFGRITLLLIVLISTTEKPTLATDPSPPLGEDGCPGLGSYAVGPAYHRNPNGAFCKIQNTSQGFFNFATNGKRNRGYLSDPSIHKIGDWYYATGTSEMVGTTNIVIFRSRDLGNWTRWMTAFPENYENNYQTLVLNQGRKFCHIWGPQLYTDPNNPNRVFMTFAAVENQGANLCTHPDRINLNSQYVTSISMDNFLAHRPANPKYFADPADNRAFEPAAYFYTVNNRTGAQKKYDGGAAAGHPIPTTVLYDRQGPNPGDTYFDGWRLCHRGMGCTPSMALDGSVFFDPNQGNKRWMIYAWMVERGGNNWYGQHIAAHPLLNNYKMNAAVPDQLLPMAFRLNTRTPDRDRNGTVTSDGCVSAGSVRSGRCLAEGGGAFYWNGWYYIYYSRNHYTSSRYKIVYRKARTFEALALARWDQADAVEYPLVASADATTAAGRSYGSGEIFVGPGDRPYVVFHAKDADSWPRTPFIKELTFRDDGTIAPLSDAAGEVPRRNIQFFIIPRPQP